jgi:hypothetical protein
LKIGHFIERREGDEGRRILKFEYRILMGIREYGRSKDSPI